MKKATLNLAKGLFRQPKLRFPPLYRPAAPLTYTPLRTFAFQGPNDPKHPLAVLVNVEVKPDRMDDFMEAITIDAVGSRTEDQCYRFDVLRDPENPCKFTFFEVYSSLEAQAIHR